MYTLPLVTHLGRPIASSKCGTVQLSSIVCPEMSSDTKLIRRWTMAVRIFLVILNLEVRLLSREMSRCLENIEFYLFMTGTQIVND